MKRIAYLIAVLAFVTMYNAEAKTRHFKGYANKDYKKALAQAKLKNKPVFMILFDPKADAFPKEHLSQIRAFLSEIVLDMVADNFIEAIVERDRKDRFLESVIPDYIPEKGPYNCMRLVILVPDGFVLYQEDFNGTQDKGYKLVSELIVLWDKYKTQRAKVSNR